MLFILIWVTRFIKKDSRQLFLYLVYLFLISHNQVLTLRGVFPNNIFINNRQCVAYSEYRISICLANMIIIRPYIVGRKLAELFYPVQNFFGTVVHIACGNCPIYIRVNSISYAAIYRTFLVVFIDSTQSADEFNILLRDFVITVFLHRHSLPPTRETSSSQTARGCSSNRLLITPDGRRIHSNRSFITPDGRRIRSNRLFLPPDGRRFLLAGLCLPSTLCDLIIHHHHHHLQAGSAILHRKTANCA